MVSSGSGAWDGRWRRICAARASGWSCTTSTRSRSQTRAARRAARRRRRRRRPGQRRRRHDAAELGERRSDSVAGADGVLAHAPARQLVMDMSTVDPRRPIALAAAAAARGISFVDAPVGRLASHAERGESLFMVGASDEDFARVQAAARGDGHDDPSLRRRRHRHAHQAGEQLSGDRLVPVQRRGAGAVAALRPDRSRRRSTSSTARPRPTVSCKINWPNKVLKGDTEPGFTIDLAHKDLTLIVDAANAAKVPMPIGAAARESFSAARHAATARRISPRWSTCCATSRT